MPGIDNYTKLLLHLNGDDAATYTVDNANDNNDGNNVKLSLHFDGADTAQATVDASTNPHAVTFENTAQLVTAEKKFGSASLLLDGDSDYVTLADSPDWDISEDWTLDLWIKCADHDGSEVLVRHEEDSTHRWNLLHIHGTGLSFDITDGGAAIVSLSGGEIEDTNWHHIAVVRQGGRYWKIYKDGIEVADVDDASMVAFTGTLYIGSTAGPAAYFDGHIDDVRITQTALWTSNFTKPAVSPSPKLVTFVDNAELDQAQEQFGNASLLLLGTEDYVSLENSDDWDFGSGNFTIDLWVRFSNITSVSGHQMLVCHPESTTKVWQFNFTNDTGTHYLRFTDYDGGTRIGISKEWTAGAVINTWYHFAVTRDGNNWRMFVDGTQIGTTTVDATEVRDYVAPLQIGLDAGVTSEVSGWIDEVRVSKGIARWVNDFDVAIKEYDIFQEYSKEFTETISTSDTYTDLMALLRQTSDTMTLSDAFTRMIVMLRQFDDIMTLSDALVRSKGNLKKFLDALTLSDTMDHMEGTGRTYNDLFTITDTIKILKALIRQFSETITISDTFKKLVAHCFNPSEIITLTESFTKGLQISTFINDSILITDNPFSITEKGETIVEISKDPQISAGEKQGDLLTIHHITNLPKLKIRDGRGVSLYGGGNYTMGSGDVLSLVYQTDNSMWRETSRGKYLGGK